MAARRLRAAVASLERSPQSPGFPPPSPASRPRAGETAPAAKPVRRQRACVAQRGSRLAPPRAPARRLWSRSCWESREFLAIRPGQLIADGHGHLVIAVLTVLFTVLMGPAATAIARRMATGFQTPFRLRHLCRIRPEQICGTAFGFRRAACAWMQRAVFRHDDLGRGVVVEDSILFAPTIPGSPLHD